MAELRGGSTVGGYPIETTKGSQNKVDVHAADSVKHITAAERSAWNAKAGTAVVTTTANGLMSSTDKTKLNGIATGANNYTLPAATASALGGVKTGTNITNSSGTISVPDGTTSAKGVVQLNNTLTSTATNQALTAAQGKALEDGKLKRINLHGQLQTTSYRKSVIALCDVDNTEAGRNSYSIGTITLHRANGLSGAVQYQFSIEKKHATETVNFSGFSTGGLSGTSIRPCTFTHGGKKYGGIEIFIADSELQFVEFYGSTNFNIFGLDYYNTSTKAAINTEVNGSLNFTAVNWASGLHYNGKNISLEGHTHSTYDNHLADTVKHITAAERTAWNAKAGTAVATTSANGLMSAADKVRLNNSFPMNLTRLEKIDLDNYRTPGVYALGAGILVGGVAAPIPADWGLLTVKVSSDVVIQVVENHAGGVYRRISASSPGWSAFRAESLGSVDIGTLFNSVSNGKNAIAAAITGKGVSAAGSEEFGSLATKIGQIQASDAGVYYDPEIKSSTLLANMYILPSADDVRTKPTVYNTTSTVHYSSAYSPDGKYFLQTVGYGSNSLSIFKFDGKTRKYTKLYDVQNMFQLYDIGGTTSIGAGVNDITQFKFIDDSIVLMYGRPYYGEGNRMFTALNYKTGQILTHYPTNPSKNSGFATYWYNGIIDIVQYENFVVVFSIRSSAVYATSFLYNKVDQSFVHFNTDYLFGAVYDDSYQSSSFAVLYNREKGIVRIFQRNSAYATNYIHLVKIYSTGLGALSFYSGSYISANSIALTWAPISLKNDNLRIAGKGFKAGLDQIQLLIYSSTAYIVAFDDRNHSYTMVMSLTLTGFSLGESNVDWFISGDQLVIVHGKRSGYGIAFIFIDKNFTTATTVNHTGTGGYGTAATVHPSKSFVALSTKSGGTITYYLNGANASTTRVKNTPTWIDAGEKALSGGEK